MNRWLVAVFGLGAVAIGCQDNGKLDSGVAHEAAPIVNGQPESGHPAVGALTAWQGGDYYGSFCTGTLIRPDWVLTAAHCLEDATAATTRFYIGQNANNPDLDKFYRAVELKIHEGYDERYLEHDIGLVRLQSPVPGVTPYPFNIASLVPYEGDEAFYIGYGAVEGIEETGSGIKRSTSFPITRVFSEQFISAYNGHGTCFGDSGGPALLTVGGNLSVIGVTSAGAACEGPGCDPCKTATTSTRVDAYVAWIADKLDEPLPSCQLNATICGCAEACQADGACNNSVCAIETCSAAYDCMVDCGADGSCQGQCYDNASGTAKAQLDAVFGCLEANCDDSASDAAYAQCAQDECGAQMEACFGGGPVVTGDDSCEQVYDCFGECGENEACYDTCYQGGTAAAQGQIDALLGCFKDRCGTIEDEDAWLSCVQSSCGTQLTSCFGQAQSCNLTGGSCEAGTACYPTTTEGYNGCFDTAGKAVGAACNDSAQDLECVDGAACLDGVCERFCTGNNGCASGVCDLAAAGVAGVGLCGAAEVPCTDNDSDGSCVEDDCNDADGAVRPGAAEQCGNTRDDDCDGETDEGCASCTDGDSDGFCQPEDCNDADPTVSPSGTERCGDVTDNDCDGQTDEGCESCTDADGDGFCATEDCNDQSTSVHPTVAETCANAIDDDCDGQVDEGCSTDTPVTPRGGGSSSGGCAGGGMPFGLGLVALGLMVLRRRRATHA